jgi:hypothetical protein
LIEADVNDDLLGESVAGGGGLVAVAGAQTNLTNELKTVASIGDGVSVSVEAITMRARHDQDVDSSADAYAAGALAGSGAGADNQLNSYTHVTIGDDSEILADSIIITSKNLLTKNKFGARCRDLR